MGVSPVLGWALQTRPALAQDWDLDKGREEEKPAQREESENSDDVEQLNVRQTEQTEDEREARAARARDAEPAKSAKDDGARLAVALSTGYGLPIGAAAEGGEDISTLVAGQVPFMIDLGVRFKQNSFIGLYFSYGVGVLSSDLADACDADAALFGAEASCSASALRFGLEFHYHIRASPSASVWLGYGFGYEWLNVRESLSRGSEDMSIGIGLHGLEYGNFQAGVEFTVSGAIALGPFLMFTLGNYGTGSVECTGSACTEPSASYDITNTATHHWLAAGVRATFLP